MDICHVADVDDTEREVWNARNLSIEEAFDEEDRGSIVSAQDRTKRYR